MYVDDDRIATFLCQMNKGYGAIEARSEGCLQVDDVNVSTIEEMAVVGDRGCRHTQLSERRCITMAYNVVDFIAGYVYRTEQPTDK